MRFSRTAQAIALLLAVIFGWSGNAPAGRQPSSGMSAEQPDGEEVRPASVAVELHDLELVDQDGRNVKFRSDAIGDRIAVVDTFFTTCGLICPILSAIFADVQERLGGRLGKEVVLVSISVDPNTDVPLRLKEYARQWDAKPGWVFLTGPKQNVDRVLQGLGLYAADFASHPAAFLVGDGKRGRWTRFYGFPSPEQLLGEVNEFSAERAAAR